MIESLHEDADAGDHPHQKIKEAQTLLRNSLHLNTSGKERINWKLKRMMNCGIAGAIQQISD